MRYEILEFYDSKELRKDCKTYSLDSLLGAINSICHRFDGREIFSDNITYEENGSKVGSGKLSVFQVAATVITNEIAIITKEGADKQIKRTNLSYVHSQGCRRLIDEYRLLYNKDPIIKNDVKNSRVIF